MDDLVVIKLDPRGNEKWRYSGRTMDRTKNGLLLEAFFNRHNLPFHEIVLEKGDRFLEAYYFDRWYNIFEIHNHLDDSLKGWYCNITEPAEILDGAVSYMDLAIDLLVYPDGRQLVLDMDEFAALELTDYQRHKALDALKELQHLFQHLSKMQLINFWWTIGQNFTETH